MAKVINHACAEIPMNSIKSSTTNTEIPLLTLYTLLTLDKQGWIWSLLATNTYRQIWHQILHHTKQTPVDTVSSGRHSAWPLLFWKAKER